MEMKNKIKKFFIILVMLITLVLISCDSLISPKLDRANPNDAFNPVPAAANLVVLRNTSDPDNLSIDISWDAGTLDSSVENKTAGYVLIRKIGSEPENLWDGTFLTYMNKDENYSFSDFDYIAGTRNYYSVFTYGSITELEQDQQLSTDENNNLSGYENYQFTGPVTGSATPWAFVDLPVSMDKYMDSTNAWRDGTVLSVTSSTDVSTAIGCITFDLTDIPTDNIKDARLYLTKSGVSLAGDLQVSAFSSEWDGADTFANLSTIAVNFEKSVSVPEGDGEQMYIDVSGIIDAWDKNLITNYGFRLKVTVGTIAFSFHSSASVDNGPYLRVWHFDE